MLSPQHGSIPTIEIYSLAAIAAIATAGALGLLMLRYRFRPWAVVAAVGGLCAWIAAGAAFALLAITAGPAPVIERGAAGSAIRLLFATWAIVWLLALLFAWIDQVRIRR